MEVMLVMIVLSRSLLWQLYHSSLLHVVPRGDAAPVADSLRPCLALSFRVMGISPTHLFTRIGYTHAPCASVLDNKEWHYSLHTTMD